MKTKPLISTDSVDKSKEFIPKSRRPWYIWGQRELSFWDKIRLLFGSRLYVRFNSPNGKCNAACELLIQITRESDLDKIKWPKQWVIDGRYE